MPRRPRRTSDPLVAAMADLGIPYSQRQPGEARPTTTEQGLGWEHQQQRARLLRTTPEGWPCPICHLPMHPATDPGSLDADHTLPRSLGGSLADRLTHRSCNRARGNGVTRGLGTGTRRPPRAAPPTRAPQPASAEVAGPVGPPRPLGGSTRAW